MCNSMQLCRRTFASIKMFNNNVYINHKCGFPLLPTLFHIWHTKILICPSPCDQRWRLGRVAGWSYMKSHQSPSLAWLRKLLWVWLLFVPLLTPFNLRHLPPWWTASLEKKIIGTYLHAYRQYTHIYAHTVHHYLALKLTSCLTLTLPSFHRQ